MTAKMLTESQATIEMLRLTTQSKDFSLAVAWATEG
jgi:hypothetical protein